MDNGTDSVREVPVPVELSQGSMPSVPFAPAPPVARPSMESLHSYLQSERTNPFPSRRGTSSFVLVHNKLSWRPSPHIMTVLIDFFPQSTPWAYGVSTPGARLYTEHTRQGLKLDGYAVQARTTYQWLSSETDEDKKCFHGSSGTVAEDDIVDSRSCQRSHGVECIPVYPLEATGTPGTHQRRSNATTHIYPRVGFVHEEMRRHQSTFTRHNMSAWRSSSSRTAFEGLYECPNVKPELSLCASVTCTSRDTLQQAVLGSWWLSRYFGISLTLEGMKQDGLAAFKELQERLFVKELRLLHGVFSEPWLQAISMCSELITLTVQACTAESADIHLQYVNPILSKQSTTEARRSPPPPPLSTPPTSNWYIGGSRSLGLLLKLKCLHIIRSPVTEGFVDSLVSSPGLECCVLHRAKRIKSLQSLASLRGLHTLTVVGSTLSTEGVAPIRECNALSSLTLEECQFVDDYQFLTGLKNRLERLSLSHNWLTDAHLQCVLTCTRLRELHLRSQKSITDVSSLGQLAHLEVLDMSENIVASDGVLHLTDRSTLKRLSMESLRCVRTWRRVFDGVLHASALVSLTLGGNDHVENEAFSTIGVCVQLRVLDLSRCSRLTTVDFLTHTAHSLRWLNLSHTAVTDASLSPLADCHALRLLDVTGCTVVTRLPFSAIVPDMEYLSLARTSIAEVALETVCVFCPKLRQLDLRHCVLLRRLSGLSRLRFLRELDLSHTRLRDNALMQLHGCRSLELINLSNCSRLTTLVDLSRVRSLKSVRAESLGGTGNTAPAEMAPSTPSLSRDDYALLDETDDRASLSLSSGLHGNLAMVLELSLRRGAWTDASLAVMCGSTSSLVSLNISECSELRQLTGLECLAGSLTQLKVRKTHIINTALVPISACHRLELLDIGECTELTSLNALGALTHLLELDASDTQVTNSGLLGLSTCQKMKSLSLSNCRYVSDINVVGSLTRLVELNVDNTAVTDDGTRQLVRCVSLKRANFARCATLVNSVLLGSGAPKQLEFLDVYGTSIPTRGVGQPQQHACHVM